MNYIHYSRLIKYDHSQNLTYNPMNYTEVVKQLLDKQYPDKQGTKTITISTFNIKFIPSKAKNLFQSYSRLKTLSLVKCDLRKLQNFPVLPCLSELDVSSNSLQGTLNHLMPLKSLTYLNLSSNIISDIHMLEPLKRLNQVEVYLLDNPFTSNHNWKYKIRSFGIRTLKEPKEISTDLGNANRKDQEVIPVKQEEEQAQIVRPMSLENFRSNILATFQRNLEHQVQLPQEHSEEARIIHHHLESPNYRNRRRNEPEYPDQEQTNRRRYNESPRYNNALIERDSLSDPSQRPANQRQQEMNPNIPNEQQGQGLEQSSDLGPVVQSDYESEQMDWQIMEEQGQMMLDQEDEVIEMVEDEEDQDLDQDAEDDEPEFP